MQGGVGVRAGLVKLKEASQHEHRQQWKAALDRYTEGIQLLLNNVRYEEDPHTKAAVRRKIEEVLDRTEMIKRRVEESEKQDDKPEYIEIERQYLSYWKKKHEKQEKQQGAAARPQLFAPPAEVPTPDLEVEQEVIMGNSFVVVSPWKQPVPRQQSSGGGDLAPPPSYADATRTEPSARLGAYKANPFAYRRLSTSTVAKKPKIEAPVPKEGSDDDLLSGDGADSPSVGSLGAPRSSRLRSRSEIVTKRSETDSIGSPASGQLEVSAPRTQSPAPLISFQQRQTPGSGSRMFSAAPSVSGFGSSFGSGLPNASSGQLAPRALFADTKMKESVSLTNLTIGGGSCPARQPGRPHSARQVRSGLSPMPLPAPEKEVKLEAPSKWSLASFRSTSTSALPRQAEVEENLEENIMYMIKLGVEKAVAKQMGCEMLSGAPLKAHLSLRYRFTTDGDYCQTKGHSTKARLAFEFEDHAPFVFRCIRRVHGVKCSDYLRSLVAEGLQPMAAHGKSGSFFFLSKDGGFVLKTLFDNEVTFFRTILDQYASYMAKEPDTLICHFYGLYTLYPASGPAMQFVVMENILPPPSVTLSQVFDLKGSTVGRQATEEEKQSDGVVILKDMDLKDPFMLGPTKLMRFFEQVEKDTKFLEENQVMDYSLLVGIMDLETVLVDMRHEPVQGKVASAFREDMGGFRATDGKDQPLSLVYYMGIIDILQPYNLRKKVEHALKSLTDTPDSISCVEPVLYRSRFMDFVMPCAVECYLATLSPASALKLNVFSFACRLPPFALPIGIMASFSLDDVKHDEANRTFYIAIENGDRALLEYSVDSSQPDVLDAYHTEVPPSMRRKGVAGIVTEAAFLWAEKNNKLIKPTCSYISESFLAKKPQYVKTTPKGKL